jgi:hypothetical protein
MSERIDSLDMVADELRNCAHGWERDARLVGNVRAEDIARLCDEFDALRGQLRCENAVRVGTERGAEILRRERDDARAEVQAAHRRGFASGVGAGIREAVAEVATYRGAITVECQSDAGMFAASEEIESRLLALLATPAAEGK